MRRPTTARAPSVILGVRALPFTATFLRPSSLASPPGLSPGRSGRSRKTPQLGLSPRAAEDQRGRALDSRGAGLGLGGLQLPGYGASLQVGAPLAHVQPRSLLGLVLEELVGYVARVLSPLVLEEKLGVLPVAVLLPRGQRGFRRQHGVGPYDRDRFRDHLDPSAPDATVHDLWERLTAKLATDWALEIFVEVDRNRSVALTEGGAVLRYAGVELAHVRAGCGTPPSATQLAQDGHKGGHQDGHTHDQGQQYTG